MAVEKAPPLPPQINELKHPHYTLNEENWFKWRLTSLGGKRFLQQYLVKFSKREGDDDFIERKQISYVPAFAKKALNKIRNAMFKRMGDVVRAGGPKSYQKAARGGDPRGVDLRGSTMTAFMGREVLPELLSMQRVGVFVDMPPLPGPTIADKGDIRPYLYSYHAENIRSWRMNAKGDPTEYMALLLQDVDYDLSDRWGLPYEQVTRYRWIWISPETGNVMIQFYGKSIDEKGIEHWDGDEPRELQIKKIPFVLFEISESLLNDSSDYQIALMNLASTDISYAIKGNYPFYTEQVDWKTDSPHLRRGATTTHTMTSFDPETLSTLVGQDQSREVHVGATGGRQYPAGLERPGFIHPSSEPLVVSMAKEEQMKKEISELVEHSLSSLSPTSNQEISDNDGADAGLQYIAGELQHGENKIAQLWAAYEGEEEPATVRYPSNFTLMTEEERQKQATFLKEMMPMIPSIIYQREMAKQIADYTISQSIDEETRDKIRAQIDKAPVIYGDYQAIASDIAQGILSLETASLARCYPEGEVPKAAKDHAEKIARIAAAQTEGQGYGSMANSGQARGVGDKGANPTAGKEEKTASQKDTTKDAISNDKTRGKADA